MHESLPGLFEAELLGLLNSLTSAIDGSAAADFDTEQLLAAIKERLRFALLPRAGDAGVVYAFCQSRIRILLGASSPSPSVPAIQGKPFVKLLTTDHMAVRILEQVKTSLSEPIQPATFVVTSNEEAKDIVAWLRDIAPAMHYYRLAPGIDNATELGNRMYGSSNEPILCRIDFSTSSAVQNSRPLNDK